MMSLHVATSSVLRSRVATVLAPSLQLIRGFGKNPEDKEDDITATTRPTNEGHKSTDLKSLLAQFKATPKQEFSTMKPDRTYHRRAKPARFASPPVSQINSTDQPEKTQSSDMMFFADQQQVDVRYVFSQFKKPTKPTGDSPDLGHGQFGLDEEASRPMSYRKNSQKVGTLKPASRMTKWNKDHSPFSDGPRLGWFEIPSKDAELMKPLEPCFYEEDRAVQVESLLKLRPTNGFEIMMKDSKYHWKYPIDNEADRGEEENVGFEQHVLLDHLIRDGFPKRGPVRHFMELVVQGLSKNYHYSPQEKQAFISWYRQYFSQFSQEELETAFPHEAGQVPPPI